MIIALSVIYAVIPLTYTRFAKDRHMHSDPKISCLGFWQEGLEEFIF